ncbi:DEAD/DEAH box helicase [Stenotrophomonas maltophilia]|uniref:DEAD/DEAH box helicase n=1 Tax=Stenotrophomonas maltophilia TaxID=40324 RepID=UPI001F52C979|nr:DEAD/DEAH box helicase [Stenotrophomonas maltophilia]MCI1130329.1 DEAD/DEAH box helicase [Stenotrophomonas maltophilia]
MGSDLSEARTRFVEYLGNRLVGPADGLDEEFDGSPLLRYMMGMLFPREDEADLAADGTNDERQSLDEDAEENIGTHHRSMPSSMGISFLVGRGAVLECEISAAIYEKLPQTVRRKAGDRSSARWARRPIPEEGSELVLVNPAERREPLTVLGGRGTLYIHSRPWSNGGFLVTVSLVNAMEKSSSGFDPREVLFQAQMRVVAREGEFLPYPRPQSVATSDQDEAEVRYLYRDCPIFARGHGVAVNWRIDAHRRCGEVAAEWMPVAEVRAATFEIPESKGLDQRYRDVEFLAFNEDTGKLQDVLSGVANAFETWLIGEEKLARDAGESEGIVLASRCQEWKERIEQGIGLLADPVAFEAFKLANRAMYWQMRMAEVGRDGPFALGGDRGVPPLELGLGYQWRPFQIAFLLGIIPSLLDEASSPLKGSVGQRDDREVVDVIWFPTGGGKTEAYLLVAAFELVRRRLIHGDGDRATSVLSRYTLRMLTTQQFQRTGMLIAALELLRRDDPTRLGTRTFSVGLWVGKSLTPNKFSKAVELHDAWTEAPDVLKNPFLLDRCPACATSIVDGPRRRVGVDCGPSHFQFKCLNDQCDFHDLIPMQVVDDALYQDPPSILLGTLDKFALLTWEERPSAFFGGIADDAPPPSLVIQDELHLISGPLGSICAPYEVAIDSVIRKRANGRGAKVIASTATIRNSREQVRGIYGRNSTVFPSPVRSWDDAFFFRLEDTAITPGRLYLGAMGQGTTTPVVSMVWVAACLLQASAEVELPDSLKDAYWTVLAYLNSRRELGRTITAASQEIPDRMKAIASAEDDVRRVEQVMELSSQMASDMGDAIRTLARRGDDRAPAVDFVPCTSIISVGVDVDRLGLMLVNGQPKLTSEYIQASSRVGRSRSAPGLVVALYSPAKPRDRSHYEDFRAYHDAFYRFVEPTSVTPYAPPARKRTIHSAIIAMIRHATTHRANDQAGSVRFEDPEVGALLSAFLQRIRLADPTEAVEVEREVQAFIEVWDEQSQAGAQVYYTNPGPQFVGRALALVRDYGDPPAEGLYEAMRSVRNVDPDVHLKPVARG